MNVNVSAWFHPKLNGDLKESLRDKQPLGRWPLLEMIERNARGVYLHRENVKLPDGSDLQILALHNRVSPQTSLSISVLSGETIIFHASSVESFGLSALAATGRGGYLEIRITPLTRA